MLRVAIGFAISRLTVIGLEMLLSPIFFPEGLESMYNTEVLASTPM